MANPPLALEFSNHLLGPTCYSAFVTPAKYGLALSMALWAFQGAAAQLTVFAAASLSEALREAGADYARVGRDTVTFSFVGSSTAARQIEEGAPADLFFSADERCMGQLQTKGLLLAHSRRTLLSNSLVVVVAPGLAVRVRAPADLAGKDIKRVALGDPRLVPSGVYAKGWLQTLGLWSAVEPKVVPTENVRAALAAVESGNAEASIVYKTDARISRKVVIAFPVPVEQGPKVSYSVAQLKASRHPEAAARFLTWVESAAAAEVFRRHGFGVAQPLSTR